MKQSTARMPFTKAALLTKGTVSVYRPERTDEAVIGTKLHQLARRAQKLAEVRRSLVIEERQIKQQIQSLMAIGTRSANWTLYEVAQIRVKGYTRRGFVVARRLKEKK